MAFSATGPVTSEHTGVASTITLPMTSNVPVGSTVIAIHGNDSSLVSVSGVSDSKSNTYGTTQVNSGAGTISISWGVVGTALSISSDSVAVALSGSGDAMARAYGFRGLGGTAINSGTVAYTESTTYSLSINNTSGEEAVMFAAFVFPFDFGVSDTPSGWTKFSTITDTADSQVLAFYKEVGSGVNTCSEYVGTDIAYLAAGFVLPYASSTTRRGQVVALF